MAGLVVALQLELDLNANPIRGKLLCCEKVLQQFKNSQFVEVDLIKTTYTHIIITNMQGKQFAIRVALQKQSNGH